MGRPLNLRDFPEDLYWLLKIRAAERHMHLKDFIVETLRKAVSQRSPKALSADQ
jgi:plasmid stability protein